MSELSELPELTKLPKFELPYYTALFVITYSEKKEGLEKMELEIIDLIRKQEGFLDDLSWELKDGRWLVMCYWKDLEAIKNWRMNPVHQNAIENGKKTWFKEYQIQISKVEYVLGF